MLFRNMDGVGNMHVLIHHTQSIYLFVHMFICVYSYVDLKCLETHCKYWMAQRHKLLLYNSQLWSESGRLQTKANGTS